MQYASSEFVFFFLITLFCFSLFIFALKKEFLHFDRIIHYFLFFVSTLFYVYGSGLFILLLLFTSSVDFSISRLIAKSDKKKYRKILVSISLILNLGILFFFKYIKFLVNSLFLPVWTSLSFTVENSTNLIPVHWDGAWVNQIILPLGISFYTFQSVGYIIEVYQNRMKPARSWLDYSLFLIFFPQLIAGPIVQASYFLGQLGRKFKYLQLELRTAIYFIIIGFFKKLVIADRLAILTNQTFRNIDDISTALSWICLIAYSIQIYSDFSGYSDLAIGIALFFGFQLPENFNFPYLASSFSDFWKRWHITLSQWLKNYLYISLGGNKNGRVSTIKNLLLTMVLGGIWHGAGWNYILWGFFHGFFLGLERIFIPKNPKIFNVFILRVVYTLFVFFIVSLLWILFRISEVNLVLNYLKKLFIYQEGVFINYSLLREFYLILTFCLIIHIIFFKNQNNSKIKEWLNQIPSLFFAFVTVVGIFTVYLLSADKSESFIYFIF